VGSSSGGEHLLSKCEALNSNPSTTKKKPTKQTNKINPRRKSEEKHFLFKCLSYEKRKSFSEAREVSSVPAKAVQLCHVEEGPLEPLLLCRKCFSFPHFFLLYSIMPNFHLARLSL
jgi:hypothetical protein